MNKEEEEGGGGFVLHHNVRTVQHLQHLLHSGVVEYLRIIGVTAKDSLWKLP